MEDKALFNASETRVGDKVRVRNGRYRGHQGVIQTIEGDTLLIVVTATPDVAAASIAAEHVGRPTHHLEQPAVDISVSEGDVTNFSRAARRAWNAMPKRAGRPANPGRKKMVSMRIDPAIWTQLGQAVDNGWIVSREEAVSQWVQERLQRLHDLYGSPPREEL